MRNLPDEHVQELLNELEEAGEQHARARASLRGLEEKRRTVKAQMMHLCKSLTGEQSGAKQEAYALVHPTYQSLVDDLVQAVLNEGLLDYRRKNAEIRWESWRSINASHRVLSR